MVVVLEDVKVDTGRRAVGETDGDDGMNFSRRSAIDIQSMMEINCSTSVGKFLGYTVKTSPGAYGCEPSTSSLRCRTSCQCVVGVSRSFNTTFAERPPGTLNRA